MASIPREQAADRPSAANPISIAPHARAAVFWLALAACALAQAPAAHAADAGRGRALYENHCQTCHTSKIHVRANKLPINRDELRMIIEHWRQQQNLPWTPAEVEDVLEYLNVTRYRFPD